MSISSINYSSSVLGSQIRNINQQLTDLSTQLSTGKLSQNYSGMGTNEGFAIAGRVAALQHRRLYRHDDQRQRQHQPRQYRAAVVDDDPQHGADRLGKHRAGSQRQRTDGRAEHRRCAVRLDGRRSQHAVRQPLSVLRNRRSTRSRSPMPATSSTAPPRRRASRPSWRNARPPTSAPTAWAGWC